jgi:hypothetical protein
MHCVSRTNKNKLPRRRKILRLYIKENNEEKGCFSI